MKTFYLVDYENVNGGGLAGCEKLDASSHVVIFFTPNARKIDMSDIANHGAATLEMIEVPAGKQSTDIHIGSYIGFLVGSHPEAGVRIVVVSEDTDFDNVIAFWQKKRQIKAYRVKKISGSAIKAKAGAKSKTSSRSRRSAKSKTDAKPETKAEPKPEAAADAAEPSVDEVSPEEKPVSKKRSRRTPRRRSSKKVVAATASDAEPEKKSDAEKAADETQAEEKPVISAEKKAATEAEVASALERAGFQSDVSDYAVALVDKHLGAKNGKQSTYRAIISKFGQRMGLEIYRHIKSLL